MKLKMLYAQQKHIDSLQQKLDTEKDNFTGKFLSCNQWKNFVSKHMSSYRRPKNFFASDFTREHVDKIDIIFGDNKNNIPSSCKLKIYPQLHSIGYIETNYIDCDELDKFIEESVEAGDIKEYISDHFYWVTQKPSVPKLNIMNSL